MRNAKIGKLLVTMVLCGTMIWTACTTAWIGEAEQIVAALLPAVANLIALVAALQGKSVSAADLQTIESTGAQAEADLQLMQSLIGQYQKADASAQPGLLNQIQAAMSAVQSSLNGLLPALHIEDAATQAKITAVVGILLSEVQSIAAIVPVVNPNASSRPEAAGMMAVAAKQTPRKPPLTASEFVVSYNAMMTAKTGDGGLDRATAGLKIHVHGKFARWASAGILK
jgi:hypothetical protein